MNGYRVGKPSTRAGLSGYLQVLMQAGYRCGIQVWGLKYFGNSRLQLLILMQSALLYAAIKACQNMVIVVILVEM